MVFWKGFNSAEGWFSCCYGQLCESDASYGAAGDRRARGPGTSDAGEGGHCGMPGTSGMVADPALCMGQVLQLMALSRPLQTPCLDFSHAFAVI